MTRIAQKRITISQAESQAAQEPLFSFSTLPQLATFRLWPMVRMTAALLRQESLDKPRFPTTHSLQIKEVPTASLDSLISGPQ